MKNIIFTIFIFLLALTGNAQTQYYPFEAGQYVIFNVGAGDSITVDRREDAPGVHSYRNPIEVVDTIFKIPNGTSLDTLSNFIRPPLMEAGVLLERGGSWLTSLTVWDDSLYIGAYGTGAKPTISSLVIDTFLYVNSRFRDLDIADTIYTIEYDVYYVDNTGTGDTLSTLSELNALTLSEGDTVKFKRGCVWTDFYYNFKNSGIEGYPIVFTSYGDEALAKPRFRSIAAVDGWANLSGNIWYSLEWDHSTSNLYIGDDYGIPVSRANLDADREFIFTGDSLLVYLATATDTSDIIGAQANSMFIVDESYITIDNLYINGTGGSGIVTYNNAVEQRGITISNCKIDSCGVNNILVGINSYDVLIENDSIMNGATDGIYVNGSGDVIIRNNYLYNNGASTFSGIGDRQQVGVWNLTGQLDMYDNYLYHNQGSSVFEFVTDIGVESNEVVNIYNNVIKFDSTARYSAHFFNFDFSVYNNIFDFTNAQVNNTVTVSLYTGVNGFDTQLDFYNNNVIGASASFRFFSNGAITGSNEWNIKNNVFTNIDSTYILGGNYLNPLVSYIDYSHNYVDTTGIDYRWSSGTSYATFEEWQIGTSQDAYSITENPLFVVDTAYYVYTNSPLIDAGTTTGITTDIVGNPRIGTIDIGCFETQWSAIDLQGAADYLKTTNATQLTPSVNDAIIEVDGWVWSVYDSNGRIFILGDGTIGDYIQTDIWAQGVDRFIPKIGTKSTTYSSNIDYPTDSTWYHYNWKINYNDSTSIFTLDGVGTYNIDGAGLPDPTNYKTLVFGGWFNGTSNNIKGIVGTTIFTRKDTVGNVTGVLYYDWTGDSDNYLKDKWSELQLTPTNVTIENRKTYSTNYIE